MSYDGGLSIKVVNGELLKILKAHLKQGTFDGSEAIPEWIGTKYKRMTVAVDYEYMDCAYIDVCPKNLAQVLDGVIALFDEYSDDISDCDAYKSFKNEVRSKAEMINNSYKFVDWTYVHEDGSEEVFKFENGNESYDCY